MLYLGFGLASVIARLVVGKLCDKRFRAQHIFQVRVICAQDLSVVARIIKLARFEPASETSVREVCQNLADTSRVHITSLHETHTLRRLYRKPVD